MIINIMTMAPMIIATPNASIGPDELDYNNSNDDVLLKLNESIFRFCVVSRFAFDGNFVGSMVGCSVDGYKWCLSMNVVGAFDGLFVGNTVGVLVLKKTGSRLFVGVSVLISRYEVGSDGDCVGYWLGFGVYGAFVGDITGVPFGFGVGSGVGILVGYGVVGAAVVGPMVGMSEIEHII